MNDRHYEYWSASPLRPKSGSNTLLHMRFHFQLFSLLRPKALCLWGYLQRQGLWRIYVCLCNRSKPIKRQKKNARSSHTETETAHCSSQKQKQLGCLCFNSLKSLVLKLQCLKMRVHATDVVPRLVLVVLHLVLSPLHVPWWHVKIAVIQMMKKYYRKQCILRHHEINDRT